MSQLLRARIQPGASVWRSGALYRPGRASFRPLLVPGVRTVQQYGSYRPNMDGNPREPQDESRWSDIKTSVIALLGVCSAIVLPTKTASCDEPKGKVPVLELRADPPKASETSQGNGESKTKEGAGGNKIDLSGPLPSIMPALDDIMDKIHSLGEMISEEIIGQVPTLADYFTVVDAVWKELQLGEGSLYQSIVNNMQDNSKNPEIQLDATVRQGNDICPQETAFQTARRKKMKKAFAKFIGVHESEVHESDIPVVALAGSGGGYRAMISSLGYMTGAKKAGLFDCSMYIAGVSGSCWMIAQYFTLGQRSFAKTLDHLKLSLDIPIAHYPSFVDTMLTNPGAAQLILEGVVQKYSKNRVLTLVDAFGTVLGSRLLIHRENDGDNSEWVDPLDFKLSQQSRWTNYGDQPLPIYTVVSHVLPGSMPERIKEGDFIVEDDVAHDDEAHYYQWFEMTPYEFGSEETCAWIPTWAFGRRFVGGKSIERTPETNLAILLGTFGSAFTATLADYYKEVKPIMSKTLSGSMDAYIEEYLDGMSLIHPLSPTCFPNPIYKLPNPAPEAEAFSQRKNIYLNDAGMDNNLPIYPLLRPGRDVDVVVAFDSSADIESVPWFEKADEYVKRRGIERWPPISKARAEQLAKQEGGPPRKMTHVEIFHGIVADDRDADHVVTTENNSSPSSTLSSEPSAPGSGSSRSLQAHPITLIYFPLIPNAEYQGDFNPATEPFCSTFNFEVKRDQVALLAGLGEKNFSSGLEDVKKVLKDTWLRKKAERLEREKQERKLRKMANTPEADGQKS